MTLNLAPLGDPDEIRREAGIPSPNAQEQQSDTEQQSITTSEANPITATPDGEMNRPESAVSLSVQSQLAPQTDVQSSNDSTPVAAATEPSVRPVAPTSIYPDPDKIKAANAAIKSQTTPVSAQNGYSYKAPVGVYIISAGLLWFGASMMFNSLILWSAGGILREVSDITVWLSVAAMIVALGLLTLSNIARWATLACSTLALWSESKELFRLLERLSDSGEGFSTAMLVGLKQFAVCSLFVLVIVYLTRPNVRKAFS